MSNIDKLELKKLLDSNNYEDNTAHIRCIKHSVLIRDDIRTIEKYKLTHRELRKNEPEQFFNLCHSKCSFLFNNYMDIFNKVYNDEIDILIMSKLLAVLKLIEDDKIDQHDGSVAIGNLLKELYLDSAVKRGDRIDNELAKEMPIMIEGRKISWREFKNNTSVIKPFCP